MTDKQQFHTPYYTAIFIIELSDDLDGFEEMSVRMNTLVVNQEGYLGGEDIETSDGRIISFCHWDSLESIQKWRQNLEHQIAIKQGQQKWFKSYQIQIARIEYSLGI